MDGGVVVVLVVPCPLALRVWWSPHGVDVCGRWWLTGLQGLGAAVRWWWWALVGAVLLVCPGGSGRGVVWCGWTLALVGVSGPAGGCAGGPPDLSWSYWPGGCRGRVNPPVPVGATGSGCASGAPLGDAPQGF